MEVAARSWWSRWFCESGNRSTDPHSVDANLVVGVRLLGIVFVYIVLAQKIICDVLDLECHQDNNAVSFLTYDLHKVAVDMGFLLFVGRLGPQSIVAIGSPGFLLFVAIGVLCPSVVNILPFMQVSLSVYAIKCTWSSETFGAVAIIVMLAVGLVGLHVRHLCRLPSRERSQFLGECAIIAFIFVVPRVTDPAFHAHHWYTSWLLALITRFQTPWSRLLQAFLIGMYVNGIAVYGRDPVLGCKVAYRFAEDRSCPWFVKLVKIAQSVPQRTGLPPVPHYQPPDVWRCNAADYA